MGKYRRIEVEESDKERFWTHVDVKSEGECWNWNGVLNAYGYGNFLLNGKIMRAHRVSYAIRNFQEDIDDLCICHVCDNRKCVNPAHLFSGTHLDNMRDAKIKGRNKWTPRYGKDNHRTKLTESDVIRIREEYKTKSASELCKKYGVGRRAISHVALGSSWSWVSHECADKKQRRMSVNEISRIVELKESGVSCKDIAETFDSHPRTIRRIIEREKKRFVISSMS